MSTKDRTSEFRKILQQMQRSNETQPKNDARKAKESSAQLRNFMLSARQIGRDLTHTLAKLEKLTLLAKRKSLFDDKPGEIDRLVDIIRQDTAQLNKNIGNLQQLAKQSGLSSNPRQQLQTHSSSVVVGLQSRLAKMSNEFKSVLELRTSNMREQQKRREKFSQAPPLTRSEFAVNPSTSLLNNDESRSPDTPSTSHDDTTLQIFDEQDAYLQEREGAMQHIQSTIVELGGIFQQLATMVSEQEEMITRIDSNVENAEMNVEMAHDELLKYFRSISSNRWFFAKVFGLLFFFVILFIALL